ncbi:hypothetical protein ONZ51_g5309 [Trametes cubensis]|uniref:F-box domain-containing protein n=1 Tax=Trametes cubensis TaxID=1111947 RepID=A0AAD7TWN8_9APHY|nr:hypothetical protein ONZ51_g5309 [Trametes cubensis]
MSSRLPIELIEHSIHFLDGDFPTLATCSLVSSGLLPICRSLLWRDVKISMATNGKPKEALLFSKMRELLALNPDIGHYVRSSSFDFEHSVAMPDIAVSFCKCFPSLRSLTLHNIKSFDILRLLAAIDVIPSLEEFHLEDNIAFDNCSGTDVAHNSLHDELFPRLIKFSVVDGQSPSTAYQQMLSFLETSRHSSSLRSLDLRIGLERDHDDNTTTGPGVPSYAPQLDHFGILLNDLTDNGAIDSNGRSHMDQVFLELPRASALRSLCIQYDCFAFFFLKEYLSAPGVNHGTTAAVSPYYLDKLSNLLSSSHTPPFPDLERLSLVFSQPLSWLFGSEAAFERLAQAILGESSSGGRRYPKFARLEVCFVLSVNIGVLHGDKGVKKAWEQFEVDKRKFVQMLADFTLAGVDVRVWMV